MGARTIGQKKLESQDTIKRLIREAGGHPLSAYQLMELVRAESPQADPNADFAVCQRISAGCSELHASGDIICTGKVKNDSSGEQVMAYELANGRFCGCGECPDGGKGYKARFEKLTADSAAAIKRLQGQVDFMEPRIDRQLAYIELLKRQIAELGAFAWPEKKLDEEPSEEVDRQLANG